MRRSKDFSLIMNTPVTPGRPVAKPHKPSRPPAKPIARPQQAVAGKGVATPRTPETQRSRPVAPEEKSAQAVAGKQGNAPRAQEKSVPRPVAPEEKVSQVVTGKPGNAPRTQETQSSRPVAPENAEQKASKAVGGKQVARAKESEVPSGAEVGPKPRGLTLLGAKSTVYSDRYTPAVLEAFENRHPGNDFFVKFNCPEFTSLCPVTGQPDFATLYISYIPDKKIVESKSLKLYLFGFRNHGAFHEDCVNIILEDLIRLLAPRYIEVWGKFLPRGGLSIDPYANYGRPSTRWEEFARQRLLMHDLTPERVDNR